MLNLGLALENQGRPALQPMLTAAYKRPGINATSPSVSSVILALLSIISHSQHLASEVHDNLSKVQFGGR